MTNRRYIGHPPPYPMGGTDPNPALSEEYHLKEYLQALVGLKSTSSRHGTTNSCFGAYNEHNTTCYEQSRDHDYLVCQVCRAQTERPSPEWIKTFLDML